MRRITQLPNKIRIVTQEFKDRESASIGVWVAAGGRYEDRENKGVAHFLEHMAFKGSAKYSCDEIKQLVEGVGGNLNAFTAEEETCYYAKVPAIISRKLLMSWQISVFSLRYPERPGKRTHGHFRRDQNVP